jgi:hypothetical protein
VREADNGICPLPARKKTDPGKKSNAVKHKQRQSKEEQEKKGQAKCNKTKAFERKAREQRHSKKNKRIGARQKTK